MIIKIVIYPVSCILPMGCSYVRADGVFIFKFYRVSWRVHKGEGTENKLTTWDHLHYTPYLWDAKYRIMTMSKLRKSPAF